jgi:hypothetical protein
MIRSSTLLPAFVLLFGLAGASLAMADNASTDKPTASQTADKATTPEAKSTTKAATSEANSWSNSCNDAPMYERPDYCHPRGG